MKVLTNSNGDVYLGSNGKALQASETQQETVMLSFTQELDSDTATVGYTDSMNGGTIFRDASISSFSSTIPKNSFIYFNSKVGGRYSGCQLLYGDSIYRRYYLKAISDVVLDGGGIS